MAGMSEGSSDDMEDAVQDLETDEEGCEFCAGIEDAIAESAREHKAKGWDPGGEGGDDGYGFTTSCDSCGRWFDLDEADAAYAEADGLRWGAEARLRRSADSPATWESTGSTTYRRVPAPADVRLTLLARTASRKKDEAPCELLPRAFFNGAGSYPLRAALGLRPPRLGLASSVLFRTSSPTDGSPMPFP